MQANETAVRVLFCSLDAGFARVIGRALGAGYEVRWSGEFTSNNGTPVHKGWSDVVLLDLREAGTESGLEAGLRWMEEINRADYPPPMIVILGEDDQALTRKVLESGAYDTLTVPPDMAELRLILRRASRFSEMQKELYQLQSQATSSGRLHELIGCSESMQKVSALARKIALCDVSVLITGETGVGKELLARAIHHLSPRAGRPFVAFSCANLPETLVEEELFGHEKGAFTGAIASRCGRFEAADGGTLFLDEVGDLPLGLQAKLLRVLQERSFERLGSNTPVTVNLRLVCATHRNLAEMVEQGKLREDLYYRLNVVQIQLPALRERAEDIPFLAEYFLQRFAQQFGKKVRRFSPLAMRALEEYNWPGNVRELENVVQHSLVMTEGSSIEIWNLPTKLRKGFERQELLHSYEEEVRDFKRRLILRTLREYGWNKAETARKLGMARGYLHRLINQLQIQPEETDAAMDVLQEQSPSTRVM